MISIKSKRIVKLYKFLMWMWLIESISIILIIGLSGFIQYRAHKKSSEALLNLGKVLEDLSNSIDEVQEELDKL